MRPSRMVPLIVGAVLVLPAAGWQLVKQSEALLREGQERAQAGAAQALSRALATTSREVPPLGPALYVHRLQGPIVLDGSRDDWNDYPGSRNGDGRLQVALAEDAARLYALIEVSDPTRVRADAGQPMAPPGDAIELALVERGGARRTLLLGNAAPGTLQAGGDPELAPRVRGEWQETPQGYRVELALPRLEAGNQLLLSALDQRGGETAPARIGFGAAGEAVALISE